MSKKLIYLFVNSLTHCFEKQGFSFSNEFIVNYDEVSQKLTIQDNPNYVSYFEAGVIKDVTLIVGKNGSGKSTILDLLGSAINRNSKYDGGALQQSKRGWVAIYHEYGDIFTIEGFLTHFVIKNEYIRNSDERKFRDGKILLSKTTLRRVRRVYENNEMLFEALYDFNGEDDNFVYMYDRNENQKPWTVVNNYYTSKYDKDISYERLLFEPTNGVEIYNFLKNVLNKIDEDFFASEIAISISPKFNINDEDQFRNASIIKKNFIVLLFENILLKLYSNTNVDTSLISYDINGYSDKKIEMIFKYLKNEFKDRISDYSYKLLLKLHEKLDRLDDKYYYNMYGGVYFLLKDKENTILEELMRVIYDIHKASDLLEIFPLEIKIHNLSSGEANLLDKFTKIYSNAKKYSSIHSQKTILLLLDEPETHFHPEWSRRFLYNLMNILNDFDINGVYFQIIITTHSPFLISDVPKENIIGIETYVSNQKIMRRVVKLEFGLMSNYYEIIRSNFFMNQTIGEYANHFFKNIIITINDLNDTSTNEQIKIIKNKIKLIDDQFIKGRLYNYLNQKIENDLNDKEKVLLNKKIEMEDELKKLNEEIASLTKKDKQQ